MTAKVPELIDRSDYVKMCRASVELYLKCERGEFRPPDEHYYEEVQIDLSAFLRTLAKLVSKNRRWGGMAIGKFRRPGFVSIKINGNLIDAPFFIASDLPPTKLLLEMYQLGLELKAVVGSTICLSGSACHAGASKYFTDIDFCEYVPLNDTALARGLLAIAKAKSSLACMYGFRFGNIRWNRKKPREWSKFLNQLERNPKFLFSKSKFRQCIHVTKLRAAGVLEATNVLLLVDPRYSKLGEGERSFAFQETPLATDWIPKDLADPVELGRYIVWLVRQISDLITESRTLPLYAVKAARRGLALARVLIFKEEAQTILGHLQNKDGGRIAALAGRCALYDVISGYEDVEAVASFLPDLRLTIDKIRGPGAKRPDRHKRLFSSEEKLLGTYAMAIRRSLNELVQHAQRECGAIPPMAKPR